MWPGTGKKQGTLCKVQSQRNCRNGKSTAQVSLWRQGRGCARLIQALLFLSDWNKGPLPSLARSQCLLSLRTLAGFPPRKEIRCPVYISQEGAAGTKEGGSDAFLQRGWASLQTWKPGAPCQFVQQRQLDSHSREGPRAAFVCPGAAQGVLWDPHGLKCHSHAHVQPTSLVPGLILNLV